MGLKRVSWNNADGRKERKVLPAYSRALPIHAKSGRERGPECALSLNGRQDDELEKDYYRV